MNHQEFLIEQLAAGQWTLLRAVEDFSEADFLVQLPNAGESPCWIFGHIAVNEDLFVSKLTGAALLIPADWHEVYQDDFPPPTHQDGGHDKAALIQQFVTQRQRSIEAIRADRTDWGGPPPSGFPAIFPTRGAVFGIFGTHQYWHIGQLMSIRALLRKPTFSFVGPNSQERTMTNLVIPKDGPRVQPRTPEQVSAYVRAELDKATEVWGIPNNLARTMACHPLLATTEVDYADSFIFQKNVFAEIPRPGKLDETVLFPSAGFIDRVTKELVISVVSLVNRSRYSITHHGVISYGVLSSVVDGRTPEERQRRAEAMLLHLVDGTGKPTFENQFYQGKPLYSDLQLAAFRIALKTNEDPHLVSDQEILYLRALLRNDAKVQIGSGPLVAQFGGAGPDDAYLDAYVDGMMVELTWNIVHFSGLLNRWFTLLKVRDEDYPVAPDGSSFIDAYNAIPESLKVRNNALLGADGWGSR